MNPYINIFGLELPTYGLLAVLGIILAGVMAVFLCRKRKLSYEALAEIALAAGIGLFLGAHILFTITNIGNIIDVCKNYGSYDSFWEFLKEILDYMNGMVFFGGLYGGLIGGYIWAKHRKYSIPDFGDVFAVATPLFHIFGRVGCLFAGCCYGKEADWGVTGRVGDAENVMRIPIQLFEAAVLLLITALIFILFIKGIARGSLFVIYMGIYAVARFILEFFRGDEIRGKLWMFSTSQWISVITVILVAVYTVNKIAKSRKAKV